VLLPCCFIISPLECRGCAMSEGVSVATQIVILDSSGFFGITNGKYDLMIIDVHTITELYFIFLHTLPCELKVYHVIVICLNCACCACYTVISALCISRLSYLEDKFVHLQCFTNYLVLNWEEISIWPICCNQHSTQWLICVTNVVNLAVKM